MIGTTEKGCGAHQIRHALMASCAMWLVLPAVAFAADITIPSGTTVTTTQTLPDVGDTGTIDSGGTIDVTDEDGLVLGNDDQTAINNGVIDVENTGGPSFAGIGSLGANSRITNNGDITGTGNFIFGIVTNDDDAVVVNSGTIDLDGDFNLGISLDGDNSSAENSGDITTNGFRSDGIYVFGDDGSATNSGTIVTSGEDAFGIYSDGNASTLINTRTITTTGDDSIGIGADGDSATVSNSGSISTAGEDADGIKIAGDDSSATNSGTINTTGEDAHGIDADGANAVVNNSGTITTTSDDATGIDSDGGATNASITNSGTISVNGNDALGIESKGNGSTITNTASGSITTQGSGAPGIGSQGNDSTISNAGSITTNGFSSFGIGALGDRVSITNTGSLSTSGDQSDAIYASNDGATINNQNTVSTSGEDAHGIGTDGDSANITNSGSITTTGNSSDGIDSDGDTVTVTNSGTLTQSGEGGNGIDVNGNTATVSTSGRITTSGADSNGVEITGNNATVTNSGTVENTGSRTGSDAAAGHGISVVGDNATVTVTSSGTTSSENGSAIYINGANATVTLQNGSLIVGDLTFTDASTASFSYEGSRTAIYGFSSVPGTLTSDGLVINTNGNTVTFFNPDEFQLGTTSLTFNALSRELADVVEEQMNAGGLNGSAFVATNGTPAETVSDRWSVWASPFGGLLNRDGNDGFDHSFGGLMAGAERGFGADYRAGVAGGFSIGHTDSNNDVHSADTYSLFVGAYASRNWQQTFAQVSLLGGYLNSSEDVTVLNNMVAGGLQDLSIDYDYLFLTPSARLGHAFALTQGTLTPSVRARYSGLWQSGDASETTSGLTVSGRSLNVLELRGETAFDFAPVAADTGALHFGVAAGIDGIFTLSDNVDGNLSGTALNLSTDNDDAVVRGFGRADAVWKSNGGAAFLASVEGGYDSTETVSATMRLGGKISF